MQMNIAEMAEQIKLSRIDNKPWGFRLTGGLDFGTPVTVIKVTANSLAELAGLKVGDIILFANGAPLSLMTHNESYTFLQEAGNFVELSVVRGSLVLTPPLATQDKTVTDEEENSKQEASEPVQNVVPQSTHHVPPTLFETIFGPMDEPPQDVQSLESVIEEIISQPLQGFDPSQENPPLTDEASAPAMPESAAEDTNLVAPPQQESEEPKQFLNDKIKEQQDIPAEEVKRELTDDEIADIMVGKAEVLTGTTIGVDFDKLDHKTEVVEKSQVLQVLKEDEVEPEKKKITTFKQVPNRPKIKPKDKPKVPPKQSQPQLEETKSEEKTENKEVQETVANDQVDAEQNKEKNMPTEEKELPNENEPSQEKEEFSKEEQEKEQVNNENLGEQHNEELEQLQPTSTGNDKLMDIKNQLNAILQLPAVMQEQLSLIQQQIANIFEEKMAESNPSEPAEASSTNQEVVAEEAQGEIETNEHVQDLVMEDSNEETKTTEGEHPDNEKEKTVEGGKTEEGSLPVEEEIPVNAEGNQGDEISQIQEGELSEQNELEDRKRDIKWQKEKPKRNKPFFPLTPHPRPIVLPGKIKFQMNPEEAYDDEFIAETLSGNAELIRGTVLGVNFQKYKKNYDHLKSSSVLRLIKETEVTAPGAFQGRPEKLPANEDCKPKEPEVEEKSNDA